MKIRSPFLAALVWTIGLNAQDMDSYLKKELVVSAGPLYANIRNENIDADEYASTRGAISGNFGLSYNFFFSKYLGLAVGAEFSQYSNTTDYKGYFRSKILLVDRDGYKYYPFIDANYTLERTFATLDVPLAVKFQLKVSENVMLSADAGFKLQFPLYHRLNRDGRFDKKGAYPHSQYSNLFYVIENEPYYGFTNATYNDEKKDVDTQKPIYSVFISAGIKVKTTEKTFLLLHAFLVNGLTDIDVNEDKDYTNVFGDTRPHAKYTIFQAGLKIGVGFKIF